MALLRGQMASKVCLSGFQRVLMIDSLEVAVAFSGSRNGS